MINKKSYFEIEKRRIGPAYPPYIVAELSANHNGRLDRALETLVMAKEMGADAVKLQTYSSDTMTIDCDQEDFQIKGGLWDGYNLYELYEWAQTPFEWHQALFAKAREIGITVFSTPFDETAVDLLEELETPAYKVASFEVIDLPLISRIAKTGKPVVMSTGMANVSEISEAVECARDNGCEDLLLLHCISSYPAPIEEANLRTIPDMADRFNTLVGLSDHTLGVTASIASVALGACFIEKHVTLSRADKGPDSAFSLEPSELRDLCSSAKAAWQALGKAGYDLKPAEEANVKFRRSIYVVSDINKGEELTSDNVRIIRPGYGVAPKHFQEVIGRKAKTKIKRGTALQWDYVE